MLRNCNKSIFASNTIDGQAGHLQAINSVHKSKCDSKVAEADGSGLCHCHFQWNPLFISTLKLQGTLNGDILFRALYTYRLNRSCCFILFLRKNLLNAFLQIGMRRSWTIFHTGNKIDADFV